MLERLWYGKSGWRWALAPLALLFALISGGRRFAYRRGWFSRYRANLPVIVVGNISVGGNGKTPVVVWLVEQLQARGWRPGVVSRGYGGKAPHYPYRLDATSTTTQAGDEPVLIARRCGCPLVVAPKRADAVRLLEQSGEVDIIITDDGLQHYALARDIELVVVDGARRFGNGCLLPMGPLRKVLEQVERDYPGEIIEVELEREDGAWVYEIKLIRKGGDVLELELDARDGSLRGIRGRDVRAAGHGAESR